MRVLVTGAKGMLGRDLCGIFEQQHEVVATDLEQMDVTDHGLVAQTMSEVRPDLVVHLAAVDDAETCEKEPDLAYGVNALGTRNVAHLAVKYGVKSFIYISTDKAVNPTSVMGATKKIGEIIIQDFAVKNDTKFSCVRFGNVLGSRGSVVPFFQSQIARGGPITVTHPDVERYFMSISEAVQLIIQAGTIGISGDIFVLDMGKPIKIAYLAKDLIRLSGLADSDIEIKFTGLRPGEKLYEEMLVDEERMKATHFQKIYIAPPLHVDMSRFSRELNSLLRAACKCDERKLIEGLEGMQIGFKKERGFE